MSSRACSHCGCSEIDTDPARGDAVCTGCGSVLEDQIIVSEIQFQENSAGGASVIGQYVSAEGPKGHSMGAGFHHGMGKESRAITLQHGKKRLQHLGNQLRLNQHCVDTAFNFFKMAVTRRLTRGRRTHHITAALLYIVCRTEGTPHMLLDFADVLQTSVYVLGRTYLQLSKELCINIPALDPCIYIQRFAHKLEFEDKTHEVSMTALRLVSRMKRDWMAQGRRPSGLCGAALLVAARIHDFCRTIKDIIRVVKIGEGTIRKRLAEFEATPSSELTIDEFQKIDLEQEMDPPCFTEGRRKAKIQQLEEQGQLPSLTSEVVELQNEIDRVLEEMIAKKASRFMNRFGGDDSSICSSPPSVSDAESELKDLEQEQATKFIQDETMSTVIEVSLGGSDTDSESRTFESSKRSQEGIFSPDSSINKDSLLMPPPTTPIGRPTAASLGITESIEECMMINKPVAEEEEESTPESGELDLTGIDDEELEVYILTDREAKLKTRIWMDANADYLKEMKEKEEREAKLREEQKDKPEKKKRKPRKKLPTKEASTAREAIEKMLQEKKISSKINYDVLRSLTDVKKIDTSSGPVLGSGPIELSTVNLPNTPQKRFRRLSSSQSPSIKIESKAERKLDLVEPEEKKPRLEQIVMESGPVEYIAEDVEEEEEEEEEEEHISAAQLMGHGAAEEDYGDGDIGYDDYD